MRPAKARPAKAPGRYAWPLGPAPHNSHWLEELRRADAFVAVVSQVSYYENPVCASQLLVAQELELPVYVLLATGVPLQLGHFKGAHLQQIRRYTDALHAYRILREWFPEDGEEPFMGQLG